MKTMLIGFIAAFGLTLSTNSFAHHGGPHRLHHWHHHGHHVHKTWHHRDWVIPAVIGGAVVYAATRPETVVIQNPPVVVTPQTVVIDGVTYTKQIMIINGVQQEVLVRN